MIIYAHTNGNFYRLVTKRSSGVNTFLVVDEFGTPIKTKQDWYVRPTEQMRLIKGFEHLTEIK